MIVGCDRPLLSILTPTCHILRGIGVMLDHNTITAEDVEKAIREVTNPENTTRIRFVVCNIFTQLIKR